MTVMNKALILKELREARWKLVVGTGLLAAMAIGLALVYETIRDFIFMVPQDQLERYGNLFPPNVFTSYSVYIWSQWNAKNLTQIGTILAILTGMSLIAGEFHGQTAGFLLTRPVSRRVVFFSKAAAGAIILVTAVTVSTLTLILTASFTPHSVEAGRLLVAAGITLLGILVIFAVTMLFSTLIEDPVKAGGAAVLVVVLISALGLLAQTRKLSLFTHMNAARYFLGGVFPAVPVVLMALSVIVLLVAGCQIFCKKEV